MNQEELHLKITQDLNKTYIEKNADYGDAFNKSLDSHGLTAAIVRMEDKMGRFSNLAGRPASMQVEESLEDTLLDLANYAIMTVMWLTQNDKPDSVDFYTDGELYWRMKQDDEPRSIQLSKEEINTKGDLVVENFNKKMDSIMNVTTDNVLASDITGYHGQVRFSPSELIRTDFNKETNMYIVGLGDTTWGSHNIVNQSFIILTLKEFKAGKIDESIAWEKLQPYIVKQ